MENKNYTAFISYSHADKKHADSIQKRLERYLVPLSLRKSNPSIPENLRPIFKDDTDMNVGKLSDRIHEALDKSGYLIVLCSRESAKSEWVNKEIDYFISTGRLSHIIPVVIDGGKESLEDVCEHLPESLCGLKDDNELLWINMQKDGVERTIVKIIAMILGVDFDTLWQRHEQLRRKAIRRRIWVYTTSAILFVAAITFGIIQCHRLQNKDWTERQNNAVRQAGEMISGGDLCGAIELLTADEGVLMKPYNSKIDFILRKAISSFEAPVWKSIATDTLPMLKNTNDVIDARMDSRGKYCIAYTRSDFVIYTPGADRPLYHKKIDIKAFEAWFIPDDRIFMQDGDKAWFIDPRTMTKTPTSTIDPESDEEEAYPDLVSNKSFVPTDSALVECALEYDIYNPVVLSTNPRIAVAMQDDGVVRIFYKGEEHNKEGDFNNSQQILPIIDALSHNGSIYAAVNYDGCLEIRKTGDNKVLTKFDKLGYDYYNPYFMAFNDKSTLLTTASCDGVVYQLDIQNSKVLNKYDYGKNYHAISISQDAETIYWVDNDSKVYKTKAPDGKLELINMPSDINALYANYDGSLLATTTSSQKNVLTVNILKEGEEKPAKTFELKCELPICESMSFSRDNEYLAILMTTNLLDGPLVPLAQLYVISLQDGFVVAQTKETAVDGQNCRVQFCDNGMLAMQLQIEGTNSLHDQGFLVCGKLGFLRWYTYPELYSKARNLLTLVK